MEYENRIKEIIESSIKNSKDLIDVSQIVGKPILNENDVIIPISKIVISNVSGMGEYGKISIFQKGNDHPYSAGNSNFVSITPQCFLIKSNDVYSVVGINNNPYQKIIEEAFTMIKKGITSEN